MTDTLSPARPADPAMVKPISSEVALTAEEGFAAGAEYVLGLPPETPEQKFLGYRTEGFASVEEVAAATSPQRALRLVPERADAVVHFRFAEPGLAFPAWIFMPRGARHETPSPALVQLMTEIAPADLAPAARVEAIIRHVEGRFVYGVRDLGLGDDLPAMPALSGAMEKGTCVDTHSYATACLRAAGIEAAYVSGLFFPQGETVSRPAHCWLAVDAPGAPHHWDIAHFLKYGLGPVRPVLNPKPGRRFAMSVGRDVVVEGRDGPVEFTRLSGFNALDGAERGKKVLTRAEVVGV